MDGMGRCLLGHEGGVEKADGVDAGAGGLRGLGGPDDDKDPRAGRVSCWRSGMARPGSLTQN